MPYLFLLFGGTRLLSPLLSIFPSSRLLCCFCCRLCITRFLGWFLRGRFPDGFILPLPAFLAFLTLVILGGTGRLNEKSSYTHLLCQPLGLCGSAEIILTPSSCIISSLSSSSWSLYFSLIFFNLFCNDMGDK